VGNDALIYHREDRGKRNQRTKLWHKDNPEKSLCVSAKNRARIQKVPFDLVPEDIIIPEVCPVFGITLKISEGKRTDNSPSLDKIIKEKGYVKGNISIISWRANRLKSDASREELEKLLEYVKNT
jgi:hypothetical protein